MQPVQPTAPVLQPELQNIVNRIAQVNNILVTVKANPSVDELAAALGLTIALNNNGKHATAVFSGQIPNAMSFLKPQKIFENNVHSLRDFIISLNKDKADKLRFAKDGEIVKIYITPYKSTITSQDLQYSEGDFNVEMVLAIGINNKEELDTVIAAHGRILHEATVATIVAGGAPSQLGSINWSSLELTSASAMALDLLNALGNPQLISPEVSTALLTGIVADTDRFSNSRTTPKTMELSAKLMNSGADHQLVTSSISGTHPHPASAQVPTKPAPKEEKPEELTLDVQPQPTPATNLQPMASTPVSPSPLETPAPEPVSSSSLNLQDILPNQSTTPTDQTIVPTNLMPPAPGVAEQPAVEEFTPLADQPANQSSPAQIEPTIPTQEQSILTTNSEQDQILSEIDQLYSAQPFDPANNPREDVGTNIAIAPTEPILDTSVQANQAIGSSSAGATENAPLQPIMATKEDATDASDVFGDQDSPDAKPAESPAVPGLEMPPQIQLPPPPPPPSLESAPFGSSQVNFNPLDTKEGPKPAETA